MNKNYDGTKFEYEVVGNELGITANKALSSYIGYDATLFHAIFGFYTLDIEDTLRNKPVVRNWQTKGYRDSKDSMSIRYRDLIGHGKEEVSKFEYIVYGNEKGITHQRAMTNFVGDHNMRFYFVYGNFTYNIEEKLNNKLFSWHDDQATKSYETKFFTSIADKDTWYYRW